MGEGLTVPRVHLFSIGQTHRRLSQPPPSSSSLTLCCSHHCLFFLDFDCCLATPAFYLFLGFLPTVIQLLFIPSSSHFHNSLLLPSPQSGSRRATDGRAGQKKGELRTPAEETDEIDGGVGGKKGRERWGDVFRSSEAAQLGLRRHTSKKGKHASALEIREEGEEDIASPKLQIKVRGFAHFPDIHLS